MASSKESPAIFREEETATPFILSTAISVVPPPMSTTICPSGPLMDSFAPSAAANGSMAALMTLRSSTSVTPLGTLMTTRGLGVKMDAFVAVLNIS